MLKTPKSVAPHPSGADRQLFFVPFDCFGQPVPSKRELIPVFPELTYMLPVPNPRFTLAVVLLWAKRI